MGSKIIWRERKKNLFKIKFIIEIPIFFGRVTRFFWQL